MRFLISLLVVTTCYSVAYGEAVPADSFDQGKTYYQAGEFDKAYDLFFDAFREDPANYTINLYLARAAYEQGDYESAIMAYERLLNMNPDRFEFRLAIARCYIRLGAFQAAEQYLDELMNDPAVGPDHRKAAEDHLAQLEQARQKASASQKRHSVSGFFIPKYSRDSNVGGAPSSAIVPASIIAGATNDVTLGVSEKRDDVFSSTLGLSHQYKFVQKPYYWKNLLFAYNARNSTESDLDVDLYGFTTGLARQADSYSWELLGLLNEFDLNDRQYLLTFGGAGTYALILTPQLVLEFKASLEDKEYQQSGDEGKDATNIKISLEPKLTRGRNEFALKLGAENEDASVNSNSYRRYAGTFIYTFRPSQNASFSASFQRKKTDYDAIGVIFTKERSDEIDVFSVEALKKVWTSANKKITLTPKLEYSYTDSRSNITPYEYDKSIVALSLIFMF